MRFLSHIRRFHIQLVEPRTHFNQYGDRIIDREGYVAVFNPDAVIENDVEFAERVFVRGGMLNGRTYLMDEVTPTPLINRLSVFDTEEMALREGWDEEFKEFVERKLTEHSVGHQDYRRIEEAIPESPWPAYEEFPGSLDDLLRKIRADGHDPRRVLAYERISFNRPAVVQALLTAIREEEERTRGALEIPA